MPIWTESQLSNDIDKGWKKVQISLGHSLTSLPFKVLIEEYVYGKGGAQQFSVYLDDLYVKDESCLPEGDCDFESGDACGWLSDPNLSSFFWQIDSGDDTKPNRPLVDNT